MNPSRAELRQFFKQRRTALPVRVKATAIASIVEHLNTARLLLGKRTIAAFMATASEVDLDAWINNHWARQGRVLLPRVADGGAMTFHPYTAATVLTPNRYDIGEPPGGPAVSPTEIEAVLVPLVAFDAAGTRLGMGGGYYDRFLPSIGPNTPVVGVAFACQESDTPLPSESWDVPLDAVVTENGMLEFGPS